MAVKPHANSQTPQRIIKCVRGVEAASAEINKLSQRTSDASQENATRTVEEILKNVKSQGDKALMDYTKRFDGFRPEPLRVPQEKLLEAWQKTPKNLKAALELAHRRIQDVHQHQKPIDLSTTGVHGEILGRRWRPVKTAGIYIPGGRAAYPSTVLMNAIPAQVAGVKEILMVSPAAANGELNRTVLAAAYLAGINTVFRIGGAQAIAALAYGTETVQKVDVISGPGNVFVTLAKKLVYGKVGIDSLAGPSEVLIIADQSADIKQVAVDLLAQAEHDPLAAAVLITTNSNLAEALPAELETQLTDHPRADICKASLKDWGLIVICEDLESCARLSDQFAPEHLELLVERPRALADRINNAGAIFIGAWTPEAVGDYLAGPNHTLPTSGTARFSGPLSVETFMKSTSLIEFNKNAFESTSEAVIQLALSEGLFSHSESIRLRNS